VVDYAKKLAEQNLVLGRFGDLHQKLISGSISILALDNVDWVQHDQAKGAPIAIANLEPVLVVTKVLVVPKGAQNSAAAELVAGWLLSDAGQSFMDKAFTSSPFRSGTLSEKFLEGKKSATPDPAFLRSDGQRLVQELSDIIVKQ
jgi:ABC-type Fe3+ transport system substrate-binding protein